MDALAHSGRLDAKDLRDFRSREFFEIAQDERAAAGLRQSIEQGKRLLGDEPAIQQFLGSRRHLQGGWRAAMAAVGLEGREKPVEGLGPAARAIGGA